MTKLKENGLYDYGEIEFEETEKATDSAVLDIGKQIFCSGWPIMLGYLQSKVSEAKNPFFRVGGKIGLSVIDTVHDAICK